MKLSLESDYALRIVLYVYKTNEIHLTSHIVEKCQIPRSLGFKIITKLVNQKILKSFPGRNGGILPTRDPANISIYDVIGVIENLTIKECLDTPESCEWRNGKCSVCQEIRKVRNTMILELKKINFKYLLEREEVL
ncbi:Rrf2 family transcriptional regulator [Cetobacterium sp. 2A]|uniref:RrF2 family transcriptional regulator n=1 Tax=Cetobacterium sp. 2A TaxID=2754723 RepID=UPI00163C1281|nr:Rrf2 family transcriptional regulator [Cetobacterium sp. 2A]MBC2856949.1 Rrf2 family transcriptional regulator [Cetobacterium sp. 2A]